MRPTRSIPCAILLSSLAFGQSSINVTVSNQKNTSLGLKGRLGSFLSTSFQPAEWDFPYFQQVAGSTAPLWHLAPQHIRIQPVSQGVPMTAPDQWDFNELDAVLTPVLSVGDHSPELQLATAPSFMNDSQGHLLRAHFQDFANYAANMVRYYNGSGFDAGGRHYQSPSPYPIHWWGIFNEPNINGIVASDYVDLYNLVVPAMQAADRTIRFVAVELSDFGNESQNNLPTFAKGVKAQVDAVGTHYYSTCNQQDTDQTVLDSIGNFFVPDMQYIYTTLQSNPALNNIPVWVTENNVNADYDLGNGVSACNGTPFVSDKRGSSAFFAAWRPYLYSQLAKAGAQSLYQWDYNADQQFGEVDYNTGNTYLSYWVDYFLAHLFPSPPGADILQIDNADPDALEVLAVRNDDGSVVVMLANHEVRSATDNNGPGVPHTVALDISALGQFSSAIETIIDASTDPSQGPVSSAFTPTVHLRVSLQGYSVAFLQLFQAKPQTPSNGIVNAASYVGGMVSPGEIVDVFGEAMGPGEIALAQVSSPGVVDNLLAGSRVWFDGIAAPLLYASARQLGAIVPYEVAGKTSTQMRVEYLGTMSAPVTIPVVPAVPGIFTNTQSGTGQASALNQDGSLNSEANPAARGSTVSLFGTGAGETTPAGADGRIASTILAQPNLAVTAQLGGIPAKVSYAGGASGIVAGGFQVNIEIPPDISPGPAVALVITIGLASSQPGVTIAVR